jgi:hypothetical protein
MAGNAGGGAVASAAAGEFEVWTTCSPDISKATSSDNRVSYGTRKTGDGRLANAAGEHAPSSPQSLLAAHLARRFRLTPRMAALIAELHAGRIENDAMP